jgi:SSS family solute:Na+ symporter
LKAKRHTAHDSNAVVGHPQRCRSRTLLTVIYSLRSLESQISIRQTGKRQQGRACLCLRPACCGAIRTAGLSMAMAMGPAVWIAMEFIAPEAELPPHFVGLIATRWAW